MLPGAKRPMNQPTPSMQAVSLLQSIIMGYSNLQEGLIDTKTFIKRLGEDVDESKVLIKFLVKNEWPPAPEEVERMKAEGKARKEKSDAGSSESEATGEGSQGVI